MNEKPINPEVLYRGFLKPCILLLLFEKGAKHGYGIIRFLEEITCWKPSPGSVYPVLKSLCKEGLIKEVKLHSRKKKYTLTSKGRELAKALKSCEMTSFLQTMGKLQKLLQVFGDIFRHSPEKIKGVEAVLEKTLTELEKFLNGEKSERKYHNTRDN